MKLARLLLLMCTVWITSCTSSLTQMQNTTIAQSQASIKQDLDQVKTATQQSTMPTIPVEVISNLVPAAQITNPEDTFDVAVQNMPANQFFLNLTQGTGQNIIVAADVSGSITLELSHVTLSQVLDAVSKQYGFSYTPTKYGYQVRLKQLETRVFYVSHINVNQVGSSIMTVEGSGLPNSSSGSGSTSQNNSSSSLPSASSLQTNYNSGDFWHQIKATLDQTMVGDTGSFESISPDTGIVVVKAYPDTLDQVANYLQAIQSSGNQQIIIEAKIIEVTLNKTYQTGVDWNQTGLTMSSSNGSISFSSPLNMDKISGVVNLLSQQGQVSVLSNPRISVTNNQQAMIKVGSDRYYVTGVNSSTTPVGSTASLASNVNLSPFFSGVALNVVPYILADGSIKLYVHPLISEVKEDSRHIILSKDQTLDLPLAETDVRETDSIIKMQNGQVVVLGGLMQSKSNIDKATFAGLEKTGFYPNHHDDGAMTELVILLQVTTTNDKTWQNQLQKAQAAYNSVSGMVQ